MTWRQHRRLDCSLRLPGSSYDDTLRYLYTGISGKDIFYMNSLLTVLWRESSPILNLWPKCWISMWMQRMVVEVAAAHAKGRRLIIGTTQLDAQRLVLWDMGAIASSGDPDALKLFRKIMSDLSLHSRRLSAAIYQSGSGR